MNALLRSKGVKIVATVGGAISGSGMASAGTFGNVTTILEDVVTIFPPIVSIVVAVVPILILVAVVGFIIGLFDGILGGIRGKLRGL